jgi:hypothetical protein
MAHNTPDPKPPRASDRNDGGRTTQLQDGGGPVPTRGSSVQGERQNAKGGPAGASQGGAPRGGSRVEPSHQQQAAKKDQPKRYLAAAPRRPQRGSVSTPALGSSRRTGG